MQFLRDRISRPAARPNAPAAPPSEALEGRVVLSATATNPLIVPSGATGSVTVDGSVNDGVIVQSGADIGTLSITAAAGGFCATVQGGATVGSISYTGAAGVDELFLEAGSQVTNSINFVGGAGDDLFESTGGSVGGSVTLNGGAGSDGVRLLGQTTIGGGISGNLDAGDDQFMVADSSTIDNVDLGFGAGQDGFFFLGNSTATGNVTLRGQEGVDVFVVGAGSRVNGNLNFNTGSEDDLVSFEGLTLQGNQTVDLGAGMMDYLAFGADMIQGSSTVNWTGGARVVETAARMIQSDYIFNGGTGTSDVQIAGDGVSDFTTVGGNLIFETAGVTNLVLGLEVMQGNATVNTGRGAGTGADDVTILGGTSIEGNAKFTLGGSEADGDTLRISGDRPVTIGDAAAGINGNFSAALGDGPDRALLPNLDVNGNQSIELGDSGAAGLFDVVRFGEDRINGSSTVNWAGSARITEEGRRDIRSDYIFNGGSGETIANLTGGGGSEVGGNFKFNTTGTTDLVLTTAVRMGNMTINTGTGAGTGADRVLLQGMNSVGGNATFTLGGSEDDVDRLTVDGALQVGDPGAGVNGNFNAALGGGNDDVFLARTVINGNQSISLGDSTDPRGDQLRLGVDLVFGSSNISWAGGAEVFEMGERLIQSDYQLTGGNLASTVVLDQVSQVGFGSSGNFSVTAAGPLNLRANTRVLAGNATVQSGAGADNVDLRDALFRGNLNVTTSAGDDLVLLQNARTEGNSGVSLSGGDDIVDNAGYTVTGSPSFNGGSGFDLITNPNQGTVNGFEG